jgi:hypothetical protein
VPTTASIVERAFRAINPRFGKGLKDKQAREALRQRLKREMVPISEDDDIIMLGRARTQTHPRTERGSILPLSHYVRLGERIASRDLLHGRRSIHRAAPSDSVGVQLDDAPARLYASSRSPGRSMRLNLASLFGAWFGPEEPTFSYFEIEVWELWSIWSLSRATPPWAARLQRWWQAARRLLGGRQTATCTRFNPASAKKHSATSSGPIVHLEGVSSRPPSCALNDPHIEAVRCSAGMAANGATGRPDATTPLVGSVLYGRTASAWQSDAFGRRTALLVTGQGRRLHFLTRNYCARLCIMFVRHILAALLSLACAHAIAFDFVLKGNH